jgi:hypothetical protein
MCADEADVDSFLLQQRTLLDVEFDELMEAANRLCDGLERASKFRLALRKWSRDCVLLVAERPRLHRE